MKKRTIAKLVALLLIVIIVLKVDLLGALFALIFLGMIPGTSLSVPPALMMIAYPIAIISVIFWLARQPLYIGSQEKQEKTARAVARKRVAKKTATARTRRRYRKAEA